jgi:hypothetical protein
MKIWVSNPIIRQKGPSANLSFREHGPSSPHLFSSPFELKTTGTKLRPPYSLNSTFASFARFCSNPLRFLLFDFSLLSSVSTG